jgi:hypothetical protein
MNNELKELIIEIYNNVNSDIVNIMISKKDENTLRVIMSHKKESTITSMTEEVDISNQEV